MVIEHQYDSIIKNCQKHTGYCLPDGSIQNTYRSCKYVPEKNERSIKRKRNITCGSHLVNCIIYENNLTI